MDSILVSFAVLAGIQSFFAPCSIALIPAYVGYHLHEKPSGESRIHRVFFGLKAGSIASLGIISIYFIFGIIFAVLGSLVSSIIPWIEFVMGGILIFLGTAVLLDYRFAITPPVAIQKQSSGIKRFYLFGVAYALGALGCTLPIFLLVVFQAFAQKGTVGGLINFVAYSFSMASLMILFSLVTAMSKTAINRFFTKNMRVLQKSAGVLVLFGGIYLAYLALKTTYL